MKNKDAWSRKNAYRIVICLCLVGIFPGFNNCSGFEAISSRESASTSTAEDTANSGDIGGSPQASPQPPPQPPAALPPPPAGPLPLWLKNAQVMEWIQIPNTPLSSVDPDPRPFGIVGPSSKIDAWCGAALRKKGSVYIIGLAGGHGDYAGNEVDALALNTDFPKWVERIGPSPTSQVVNGTQFYLDLRPSATHTYYASQFIDSLDRFVVVSSPGMAHVDLPKPPTNFPYDENGEKHTSSFNWATSTWDAPEYFAAYPGTGDFTAALVVKHPVTDDIYYSKNYSDGWYRWTKNTNTWTKLSDRSRGPWFAGAAIDPKRNRILVIGGYSDPANPNLNPPEVLNLDGSSIAANFTGLDPQTLGSITNEPGVIYDEVNDRFLVLYNSGANIQLLAVNAATFEVSKPAVLGALPQARPNGIQNSVQYVPELRGIVIANSHSGNVYFMRTSP